jgi:hypothetical protein
MSIAEMRMLRWMNGEDRIRNEYMRGSIDLASIVKNMNNVS